MKKVLFATASVLALFSASIVAQRVVHCPSSNQITVATNSKGQICWYFRADNPDGDNGQFFLSCLANKPRPTGGSAILARVDGSVLTNGSTYILCYYNTNPQSANIDQTELWVRLQGNFKQVGPTTFEEVTPGSPPDPITERQITTQQPMKAGWP